MGAIPSGTHPAGARGKPRRGKPSWQPRAPRGPAKENKGAAVGGKSGRAGATQPGAGRGRTYATPQRNGGKEEAGAKEAFFY